MFARTGAEAAQGVYGIGERPFGQPRSLLYNRGMQRYGRPLRILAGWPLLVAALLLGLAACGRETPTPALVASPTPALPAILTIHTEPAGALVTVGDDACGAAPLELSLEPAIYDIALALPGYASDLTRVTLVSGERVTITRELQDVTPPVLTLTLGDTVIQPGAGLKIDAQAEDNDGIASLCLLLNGALWAEHPGDRLIHNLDTRGLPPGIHELQVVAHDAAGNTTEEIAHVTILAPPTATPTAIETATPTQPAATETPEVAAAATALPAVVDWWDELTIETMGYEEALYTAPEQAGHPYPLLDRGAMTPSRPVTYEALRVRNEYLDLTFLPSLGGRLYQVRFVPTGQALFWSAPVIKPTHWGPLDQGWWLAVGGMEWCLPVDEHGYLTAEPWEVTPLQRDDGGITVRIGTVERTRNMAARVDVTLLPGEAALRITTHLENPNDVPISYQYWMNAILSPGAAGIGPDLRMVVPTEQVVVHSTGDDGLPGEHGVMGWPQHDGRDMSVFGNWRNWLGFFATRLEAPFTAVYSPATALGLARVHPPEVAQGAKLFAFAKGFGDTGAYTNDGSYYAEMWGGVTPTFWDYATLGPGERLTWQETWWVLAGSDVPCAVNESVSLAAGQAEGALRVTVAAAKAGRYTCQVTRGDGVIYEEAFEVRPDAAWSELVALGEGEGALLVRLLDGDGAEVLRCSP